MNIIKNAKKFVLFFLIILLIPFSFAHSGRTDSKGGHYDSSTGEYHYHHGNPAHTICGVNCPYKPNLSKSYSNNADEWEFDSLCGLSACCLFLGFTLRFFIFLPLLIIDYIFKKEFYTKLVLEHSFISSLIAGIPFFFIFIYI